MGGLWGFWAFCPACKAVLPPGAPKFCPACAQTPEKAAEELAAAGEFTEKGWRAHEKEAA